jgi:acetyl esterase/lipase
MFLPDCRKLGELGTDVRVHEFPGGFHVFVAVVGLRESRQARAIIAQALA